MPPAFDPRPIPEANLNALLRTLSQQREEYLDERDKMYDDWGTAIRENNDDLIKFYTKQSKTISRKMSRSFNKTAKIQNEIYSRHIQNWEVRLNRRF